MVREDFIQRCLWKYYCTKDGRVFRIDGDAEVPFQVVHGYKTIQLYIDKVTKVVLLHRFIAAYFLGQNPLQVDHKDRDRLNNHIDNLEYVTRAENIRRKTTAYWENKSTETLNAFVKRKNKKYLG